MAGKRGRPKKKDKRRSPGQGALYQIKDGSWCAAVVWQQPDGTRKRYVRRGQTPEQAAARMQALTETLSRDVTPTDASATVSVYLRRWLADAAKPTLAPASLVAYARHLRHLEAQIGALTLAELAPTHLARAYAALQAGGLSATSVNTAHNVLHRALGQAVEWGLLDRNPADRAKPPRKDHFEARPFDATELQTLLDYAEDHGGRETALWLLLATTGLRIGEAMGLRWGDCDLDQGIIYVRQQIARIGGVRELKTRASSRAVRLVGRTHAALRAHRVTQAEEQLAAEHWPPGDFVFRLANGQPYTHDTAAYRFHKLLAAAGLGERRLHDLRHGLGTYLAQIGVNPRVVQAMLGHATLDMTLRVYTSVTTDMQSEAVAKLDDLLKRRSG